MKTKLILLVGTLMAVMGCTDRARDRADAIQDTAQKRAEAIRDSADKTAENLKTNAEKTADTLENRADAVRENADDRAQSVQASAERKADAVEENADKRADAVKKTEDHSRDHANVGRLDRGDIKDAQKRLIQLGYLDGKADGVIGAKTRDALRRFQDHEGLADNGQLNRVTMDRLDERARVAE